MNGVIGMTSLLLNTDLNAEQSVYVDTIRKAATPSSHPSSTISLTYRKPNSASSVSRSPLDVRSVVEDTLDLLASKPPKSVSNGSISVEPDVPAGILGDTTPSTDPSQPALQRHQIYRTKGVFLRCSGSVAARQQGASPFLPARHRHRHRSEELQPLPTLQPSRRLQHAPHGGNRPRPSDQQTPVRIDGRRNLVDSEKNVGSTFHFTLIAPVSTRLSEPRQPTPHSYMANPPSS